MRTASINIKTEPALKKRLEGFAKNTGMSISDVVNLSIRETLTKGSITIQESFVPNAKTGRILKQALKDIKAGKNLSPAFHSAEEMDSYLNKL